MSVRVRLGLVAAAIAGLALAALLVISQVQTTSAAGDDADIRAAVTAAIKADNSTYLLPASKLPSGAALRDATSGDRVQMRNSTTSLLSSHMTGKLLSQRLSEVLPWDDSMTSGHSDKIFDLFKNVEDVTINSVVRQGNAATVTGTYTVYVQHAQVADPQGHLVTWGGRGTLSFTANFVHQNGHWLMSDLSLSGRDGDYVPDPSLLSGLQYVPSQTKPPTDSAPIPAVP